MYVLYQLNIIKLTKCTTIFLLLHNKSIENAETESSDPSFKPSQHRRHRKYTTVEPRRGSAGVQRLRRQGRARHGRYSEQHMARVRPQLPERVPRRPPADDPDGVRRRQDRHNAGRQRAAVPVRAQQRRLRHAQAEGERARALPGGPAEAGGHLVTGRARPAPLAP